MMSEREADEMAKYSEVRRWSSDSEGDDVPILQTMNSKTGVEKEVIPDGQAAVGAGIARFFGKDLGVFKGQVVRVEAVRRRHMYHVKYEDGDSEDFDQDEYIYAYAMRKAVDRGKSDDYEHLENVDLGDDGSSSVEGSSPKCPTTSGKRIRKPKGKKGDGVKQVVTKKRS